MKKILIVSKALDIGGIESALINMANELQKHYQVDLLLYNPAGDLMKRLQENIGIIAPCWQLKALGMPLKEVLHSRNVKMILYRILVTAWTKMVSNRIPVAMAAHCQNKLTGYDIAIAYHQEMGRHTVASGFSRIVDRCVEAKQKLAWLHYDSAAIDLDSAFNNPFYQKMDRIVCVSQSLKDRFAARFPKLSHKTDWCYNFLEYDTLYDRSMEKQNIFYPPENRICFCACRLAKEKALVRAIHCLAPVFREHGEWLWYIAGEGPERGNIEEAIMEEQLGSQVILLGNQTNPYPYIKNADLLMNLSYHEASPMVFREAIALGTPVLATKTSSAVEMLPIGAFVCGNTEGEIAESFRDLAEHPDKLEAAKYALRDVRGSNKASLLKFEQWLTESDGFYSDIPEMGGNSG